MPTDHPRVPSNPVPSSAAPDELNRRLDAMAVKLRQTELERDDLAQRLAAIPKTASTAAAHYAEAEKALLAIRQARDEVLSRNHELIQKLAKADDRIAELEFERDDALNALKKLEATATHGQEAEQLQREIATLGETVTALEAGKLALAARVAELESTLAKGHGTVPEIREPKPGEERPIPVLDIDGFDTAEAILAIAADLAAMKKAPKVETARALAQQFSNFAEHARITDFPLLHRVSALAADLTYWTVKFPAKIPGIIPTLDRTMELLDIVATLRSPETLPDVSGLFVYAVDDDVDNCECIAMALEKISVQTRYAVDPSVAIDELENGACSLIVLDVDLPGTDGIALHSRIRAIPHHEHTPVIFVSGHLSTPARIAGLPGENDFVAKPYNLNELTLRSLALITRTQLAATAAEAA